MDQGIPTKGLPQLGFPFAMTQMTFLWPFLALIRTLIGPFVKRIHDVIASCKHLHRAEAPAKAGVAYCFSSKQSNPGNFNNL